MLTRLEIRNFRSLRHVVIEPGQTNFLIGPNGSGKTNLYKAIQFLALIALNGFTRAINALNGFSEIAWKGGSPGESVEFLLDYDQSHFLPGNISKFSYELKFSGGAHGLIIEHEFIKACLDGSVKVLADRLTGKIYNLNGAEISGFTAPNVSLLEINLPGWPGNILIQAIRNFRLYTLAPLLMRTPNQIESVPFLQEHGQNLTSFLASIRAKAPANYKIIQQIVKDAFPWIQELVEEPMQSGHMVLAQHETGLNLPLRIWDMPAGELAFLALTSLIHAPAEFVAPLFFIEEPENHLHPRLLELLYTALRQKQDEIKGDSDLTPAQIFISTHSPYLIDLCEPEEVMIFERSSGESKISRIDHKNEIKQVLDKDTGLGALWFSGAIGGV